MQSGVAYLDASEANPALLHVIVEWSEKQTAKGPRGKGRGLPVVISCDKWHEKTTGLSVRLWYSLAIKCSALPVREHTHRKVSGNVILNTESIPERNEEKQERATKP
jgi:hypothetical protein